MWAINSFKSLKTCEPILCNQQNFQFNITSSSPLAGWNKTHLWTDFRKAFYQRAERQTQSSWSDRHSWDWEAIWEDGGQLLCEQCQEETDRLSIY